ncbi:MAG: hypothetical protein LBU06_06910 [Desulfovibrio sp.]|nr:hypothetical protein [Desulfovibrio sp.]
MSQNISSSQAVDPQFPAPGANTCYADFGTDSPADFGSCDDLSKILGRLKKFLSHLDLGEAEAFDVEGAAGSRLILQLSDSLSKLQDDFLETLNDGLERCGADLSAKRTLRLEGAARLVSVGDDPQRREVESLLASDSRLASVFAEISARAFLLRALRELHNAVFRIAPEGGAGCYQLSLKGDMSHFYFAKPSAFANPGT